jgi:hypothetical protein
VTNTGPDPVTLGTVSVGGADPGEFARLTSQATDCVTGMSLAPGATCKVRVTFDPSATGAKAATVVVPANGGASVSVGVSGTGIQTQLSTAPAALSLGSQDIDDGPTAAQESTITNTGTEPVPLTGVTVNGGDFAQATGDPSDCAGGVTLAAGQTCKMRVRFDPTTTGAKTGTANVSATGVPDIAIPLDGTGIQTDLSRSPNALDFGSRSVAAPASAAQELALTNSGTQTIALSGVTLGGAAPGQFQKLSGQATDCTASTTLAAGDTCKVRVRFHPTSAGAKTASVIVASGAGADLVIPLSGTGTPRPRLTIPPIRATAGSTASKRLKVPVTPVGGTISRIVVEIRSRSGKLLGSGQFASASRTTTVVVRLKNRLPVGRYVARATGHDAFGNTVHAPQLTFQLPLRLARPQTGGGGGGGGGGSG